MWNNTTKDFYPILTENNFPRILCLGISCSTILFGIPFLLSIIWFERFGLDKTRTIINMLVARVSLTKINFLLLVQVPEIVRYTYGPLPDWVCLWQTIFRDSFTLIALLHFDAIVIVRYGEIIVLFYPKLILTFDSCWNVQLSLIIPFPLIKCLLMRVVLMAVANLCFFPGNYSQVNIQFVMTNTSFRFLPESNTGTCSSSG